MMMPWSRACVKRSGGSCNAPGVQPSGDDLLVGVYHVVRVCDVSVNVNGKDRSRFGQATDGIHQYATSCPAPHVARIYPSVCIQVVVQPSGSSCVYLCVPDGPKRHSDSKLARLQAMDVARVFIGYERQGRSARFLCLYLFSLA